MKPRIRISFSGGRSSALMTKLVHDRLGQTHDILTTFANTGCEHAATLDFVRRCDEEWGWGVVWLEAVVNPEVGMGITSKVVNYETVAREGEPFKAAIAKYGLPNPTNPWCTDRLKADAMDHHCHHVHGWARRVKKFSTDDGQPTAFCTAILPGYQTAIGIRWDEADRINKNYLADGIIYPLIEAKLTRQDVLLFWKKQPFDLDLPEHLGNCTWCWKKSLRKHLTLAVEAPEVYEFPARMEREYGHIKAEGYAAAGPDGRRHFFRGHLDTTDIIEMAKYPFEPFREKPIGQMNLFDPLDTFDPFLDVGGGCGDSCEAWSDDT